MVSKQQVMQLARKYNINLNVISPELLTHAIKEEYEHKDIIGKDPEKALRIALAHLEEFPDYYNRLAVMVNEADAYWSKHKRPNIYQ